MNNLTNWNVPADSEAIEKENLLEELKRLRIVARMAAQVIPDLDVFLIQKCQDAVFKSITQQKYLDYERKNHNLKVALKFAGYTEEDAKTGELIKPEAKTVKINSKRSA